MFMRQSDRRPTVAVATGFHPVEDWKLVDRICYSDLADSEAARKRTNRDA